MQFKNGSESVHIEKMQGWYSSVKPLKSYTGFSLLPWKSLQYHKIFFDCMVPIMNLLSLAPLVKPGCNKKVFTSLKVCRIVPNIFDTCKRGISEHVVFVFLACRPNFEKNWAACSLAPEQCKQFAVLRGEKWTNVRVIFVA